MIDRDAVTKYDKFYNSVTPCQLETELIPWRLFKKARVIKPSLDEISFDQEYDVIVVGGGPSGMLIGSVLAKCGYRVVIFERNNNLFCGATWNLSRPEFEKLKKIDILSSQQWEEMIVGEFKEGVFRLYDSQASTPGVRDFHFDDILNLSISEERFFETLLHEKSDQLEIRFGCMAYIERVTRSGVYVTYNEMDSSYTVKGKLLIDACGWTSPIARITHQDRKYESVYNLIGVHTNQTPSGHINPETKRPMGIICGTYEDEIESAAGYVQPILERFSDYMEWQQVNNGDVFYYFTRTEKPTQLSPLIDDMLSRLHFIIDGFDERYVNKTFFGHIPAYYPPRPFASWCLQASAGDRILLIGCAAQQYSGLTGGAFGVLARNAFTICNSIDYALNHNNLSFKCLFNIDIDIRERASQAVENMFGGSMELDDYETPGTVNRDWLAFARAAEGMEHQLKNEAFRDKIRLKTLHQILSISVKNPEVIVALLRNNRGHIITITWTFICSYLKLLLIEMGYIATRRQKKYLKASFAALYKLPFHLVNSGRLCIQGIRESRKKGGKK